MKRQLLVLALAVSAALAARPAAALKMVADKPGARANAEADFLSVPGLRVEWQEYLGDNGAPDVHFRIVRAIDPRRRRAAETARSTLAGRQWLMATLLAASATFKAGPADASKFPLDKTITPANADDNRIVVQARYAQGTEGRVDPDERVVQFTIIRPNFPPRERVPDTGTLSVRKDGGPIASRKVKAYMEDDGQYWYFNVWAHDLPESVFDIHVPMPSLGDGIELRYRLPLSAFPIAEAPRKKNKT